MTGTEKKKGKEYQRVLHKFLEPLAVKISSDTENRQFFVKRTVLKPFQCFKFRQV